MRPLLIILGIIQIPFPIIALYLLIPTIRLFNAIESNNFLPILGLIFFLIALILAISQLLSGIFRWDKKLGKEKTKILLILGSIFGILSIPGIMIFILNPIYSVISGIK